MRTTITKADAIMSLCPGAEWVIRGEVLEWIDSIQTEPTADAVTAEIKRLKGLVPWNELRTERNRLIAETDYLALSDATMTDEMKFYRQALRDIPSKTTDPTNPVWPTKPGGEA